MTANLRLCLLVILLCGLIWIARRRIESFATNVQENALCQAFVTEDDCNDASTDCVWCPSQAPMCVMDGCCTEPGKGGLYKTTSECTEESKNLRGGEVAAAAAGNTNTLQLARNQIDTNIASKAASVFLNKGPAGLQSSTPVMNTPATLQATNRLPLPASVQAVSQSQQPPFDDDKPANQRPSNRLPLPAEIQAVSRPEPAPMLSTPPTVGQLTGGGGGSEDRVMPAGAMAAFARRMAR
jgi:hypothetical protein